MANDLCNVDMIIFNNMTMYEKVTNPIDIQLVEIL